MTDHRATDMSPAGTAAEVLMQAVGTGKSLQVPSFMWPLRLAAAYDLSEPGRHLHVLYHSTKGHCNVEMCPLHCVYAVATFLTDCRHAFRLISSLSHIVCC